ncbi:MAG: virulence RhuM family protein [Pirellulales bacterium]|nr:virulence RhuM family protein [Pirellulales bacterium]
MTKDNPSEPLPPGGQMLIYRDGALDLQVRLDGQTVWLTQAGMAELFQTSVPNINIHIRNILQEEELERSAVIKEYLITAADGKNYQTKHYNLDMILAVGYRVRSARGTQFRQWATARLRELLVKGFVLDDERIKSLFAKHRLGVHNESRKQHGVQGFVSPVCLSVEDRIAQSDYFRVQLACRG